MRSTASHLLSKTFRHFAPYVMTASSEALNQRVNFEAELAILDSKKAYFADYYEDKSQEIKSFFAEEEFEIADVLFDLLRGLKGDKLRKNGYIPDYGHEIDQLLPVIEFIKNLDPEDRQMIEDHHGSLERWVCSVLVHDIGEDFNFFPEDLTKTVVARLDAQGKIPTKSHLNIIDHAAKSMECLTHYRKFSYADIQAINPNITLPKLKEGEVVPIDDLKDYFWNKMDVLDHGRDNLQVYARLKEGKSEPEVIVTRYGATREDAPENEQIYMVEWHIYVQHLVRDDMYDALTKLGDRIHGMATRVAMDEKNPDKFSRYLGETELLFDHVDVVTAMESERLYSQSPLLPTVTSMSKMMGLLDMFGKTWIMHHPDNLHEGERGVNVDNLDYNRSALGLSPISVSKFLPEGLDFYAGVDQPSHPIGMMMRDMRQVKIEGFIQGRRTLHDVIEQALVELDYMPEEDMRFLIWGERGRVGGEYEWYEYDPPKGYEEVSDSLVF